MRGKSHTYTIIPSAARTASEAFDLNGLAGEWDEIVGYLDVTAKSGTTPTLDIDYETTVDGSVYFNNVSFTQATTATTEKKTFVIPFGIDGRLNTVIGGSDTPTFTYSLTLECKRSE